MMLGDAGVGKTSIARRFVDDAFANNYIHTIGIDFLEKIIECQGQEIKLQIWDTAGQDRYIEKYFVKLEIAVKSRFIYQFIDNL